MSEGKQQRSENLKDLEFLTLNKQLNQMCHENGSKSQARIPIYPLTFDTNALKWPVFCQTRGKRKGQNDYRRISALKCHSSQDGVNFNRDKKNIFF